MNKIRFTFWVTEECNLRCRYCYVKKQPIVMNKIVAKDCLAFVDKIAGAEGNEQSAILISFHGGEPLLNFEIIRDMTKELNQKYSQRIMFRITTNGTVYDEKIFSFLIYYKFQLSISIDGTKDSNDLNRIDVKGNSSYQKVIKTLDYFNRVQYEIRVRMTVNPRNVNLFADGFKFLFLKGHKAVAFAIDMFDETWNKAYFEIYEQQLGHIIDFLEAMSPNLSRYYLDNIKSTYLIPRLPCKGGQISFHIDGNGVIFPCMHAVQDHDLNIGNIRDGIDQKRYIKLKEINALENPGCRSCKAKDICSAGPCKIINKVQTGEFLIPSNKNCSMIRVSNNLIKLYEKG
ncbi:radical SAM protein [Clostridium sp. E02]|uniref:radical SAM/SPASM domain-containing protein n=1 Tax=Clostridium sp. E02 TaxID=2487134 RepID=UPI000F544466|nr:radical SAM protein [Clostridium sp. E02]